MKYYTLQELSRFSDRTNGHVSVFGNVLDLTSLLAKHSGDPLLRPILQHLGKDLSHWFDDKTGDVRYYIHPVTNLRVPYTPEGPFLHVPPIYPSNKWKNDYGTPWWKNTSLIVGKLANYSFDIKIVNTLTSQVNEIEVAIEDTVMDILERYLKYNSHAASYAWKYDGRLLDMFKTLEENGIEIDNRLLELNLLSPACFLPEIHLYFKDDLTEE
ncbi:Cytochrome b5 domain-containing protein 1 [Cichlidogyrus casuarinus]|uniref:Cytochrome b5 domain-containing protein 1 n=1 Tax=Cichlidogyrus casuarinus TaxID=1844966 RepID=A0ABD2QBW7_9PLAT